MEDEDIIELARRIPVVDGCVCVDLQGNLPCRACYRAVESVLENLQDLGYEVRKV